MILLQLPLEQVPLAFVDLETTGLQPGAGDRVCEIAVLRLDPGQPPRILNSLINPQRPVGAQAQAVHRIPEAALLVAPLFSEVLPQLFDFLQGAALVAHNAPFDVGFINSELLRLGLPLLTGPVIDTLNLSRRLLRRRSHSLSALAAEFSQVAPDHRALTDVYALQQVYTALCRELPALGIQTLADLLRFQRGLLPGQPEPEPPEPIAAALAAGYPLRLLYRSRSFPEPVSRIVQPLAVSVESSGVYLRAFCYLRNDQRAFALDKILQIELLDPGASEELFATSLYQ